MYCFVQSKDPSMTTLNFLIAGLERISDDPGLSRRALLRHPLHRNIPRLPPGEKESHHVQQKAQSD